LSFLWPHHKLMLLFIVFLVVAVDQCNFVKNGPIRLLFRRGERGSRLVSRRIVVLRTRSVLRSLSFIFARCHLSLLAVSRPLLLHPMSSSLHFRRLSLHYVAGLEVLVTRQRWAFLIFAQCQVSCFCRVGRWFFALCRRFFALCRRLLGRFQQVISLWGLLSPWLDSLGSWGPL